MKFSKTLMVGLAVATGAAITALVVSTAADTTTASGSNTVFVPRTVGLARNGETGILVADARANRGVETGTPSTNGTGGGTSTPPRPGGMSGGTGI